MALGVLVVVANIATGVFDQWRAYRFTVEDASREMVNTARILAAQTEGTFKTVDVLLRDIAASYPRIAAMMRRGEIDAALAGRVEGLPQVLALTISDAQGIIQYRSGTSNPDPPTSIADRSYFKAQRDNPAQGLFVSEPIVTKLDPRAAIALSRRLSDENGRFAGVVTATIDLDYFQRLYRQIKLGPQSSIVLMEDDGTLIVRDPPAPDKVGKAFPGLAMVLLGERGNRMVSPIDGVNRFVAGAHVEGFPLVAAVSRQEEAVLDPWRAEFLRVVVQDVVLSLLIAAAIAALVYQLSRVERGERALRESEERYALAMEGANEGHFDRSLTGGPTFWSPKMRELMGLGGDAPADGACEIVANIHPEDRPELDAALERHLEGLTATHEVEYRVRHPDGEWHWLQVRGRCLHDSAGQPSRLVGSVIDITERKRAESERDRLEAQLVKSQKMEAMGTLAGGIAHDFNNILGAILGYGELAQKNAAAGSLLRRYVDNVMHAAERAKALVEQILAFSRSGLGERAPVNVQAVISETLDLLAASLPGRIQLVRKLNSGDAAVIGNATQLHQVVMNLCTNAVQAMPAGGVLEVSLDQKHVPDRRSVLQGELTEGPYVSLSVRDTGEGIEPRVLDRMFDPFFTTKGVGSGTGLGLSLVHGIVADFSGAIDVTTAPGEGTTFTIWLPVSGSAPAARPEAAGVASHGNGEVIMIVDDERPLVELTEEMLAELGYEPVGFESSRAALNAFSDDPRRFDAVLSDEMMPELSGTALAVELHRLRPDLPILIMSGYVDSAVTALAGSAGVSDVLRKPLKSRDIAEALARALSVSSVRMHAAR